MRGGRCSDRQRLGARQWSNLDDGPKLKADEGWLGSAVIGSELGSQSSTSVDRSVVQKGKVRKMYQPAPGRCFPC